MGNGFVMMKININYFRMLIIVVPEIILDIPYVVPIMQKVIKEIGKLVKNVEKSFI